MVCSPRTSSQVRGNGKRMIGFFPSEGQPLLAANSNRGNPLFSSRIRPSRGELMDPLCGTAGVAEYQQWAWSSRRHEAWVVSRLMGRESGFFELFPPHVAPEPSPIPRHLRALRGVGAALFTEATLIIDGTSRIGMSRTAKHRSRESFHCLSGICAARRGRWRRNLSVL